VFLTWNMHALQCCGQYLYFVQIAASTVAHFVVIVNDVILRRIRKMSTLSSANVTDVNLVLKEPTHMRLCINMLIFTHNLGNLLIRLKQCYQVSDESN